MVATMLSRLELMTKALELRKQLGLDDNAPIDIFRVVEKIEKLTIVFYSMGKKISGICTKSKNGHCVVAINSDMTLGRERFTLAHELYHKYYGKNNKYYCESYFKDISDEEREANLFASYFLMPEFGLHMEMKNLVRDNGLISLKDVLYLCSYYGVSYLSMVNRLFDSSYIDEMCFNALSTVKGIIREAVSFGYNVNLFLSPKDNKYNTFGYYIYLVQKAKEEELISDGKYEELLLDAFRSDIVYGDIEDGFID